MEGKGRKKTLIVADFFSVHLRQSTS